MLVALVYIAFANVFLLDQTLNPCEPNTHMRNVVGSSGDGLVRAALSAYLIHFL
jgi:hypothetical protein